MFGILKRIHLGCGQDQDQDQGKSMLDTDIEEKQHPVDDTVGLVLLNALALGVPVLIFVSVGVIISEIPQGSEGLYSQTP